MICSKEDVLLPAKISVKPNDKIFCNVMPCMLGHKKDFLTYTGGVKIVTRYPERKPSLDSKLLLFDVQTGEFLSLMDANWITAMRTGAVAAHSIILLAKKEYSTIGIVDLGNTARAMLLVLATMNPDKKFLVKILKYKGQEESFIKRFQTNSNLKFVCVDDAEALVRGSDVVVSAVTFLEDNFCSDNCFEEGVLVVPIHTRGFTNCDLFFDKIYADDYGHVKHFKYFNKFRYFAEVSDVVNNKAVGRENNKERILAYNIGVSMYDINFAAHIYQLLIEQESITDIDLHDPTEKFWI